MGVASGAQIQALYQLGHLHSPKTLFLLSIPFLTELELLKVI